MMTSFTPPKLEIFTGVEVYKSKIPGIGGKIKTIPSDFIVEEIPLKETTFSHTDAKEYVHFTLEKYNWDNLRILKEISRGLGVSRTRIEFAGTKDKRGITKQRVSARNVPLEKLMGLKIRDAKLSDFTYSDKPIRLGELAGNKFIITIRKIDLDIKTVKDRIEKIAEELKGGVPNFFGIQRFGSKRPNTHLIGREIVIGDYRKAVMIYLSEIYDDEDEESKRVRSMIKQGEFKSALRELPKHMGFEATLLNHLVKHPDDFKGALNALPKSLVSMFTHAYQSYIFNKSLSEYIRMGYTAERLPLIGTDVNIDEITGRIFEKENIGDIRIKGGYRDCFVEIKDFELGSIEKDESGGLLVNLGFSLPKASYATGVLREFMKNDYWTYE